MVAHSDKHADKHAKLKILKAPYSKRKKGEAKTGNQNSTLPLPLPVLVRTSAPADYPPPHILVQGAGHGSPSSAPADYPPPHILVQGAGHGSASLMEGLSAVRGHSAHVMHRGVHPR